MTLQWLDIAKEIQSIAQAGLTYAENKYDRDRYEQLRELSIKILEDYTNISQEKIRELFASEEGYQTPKVDVRAVIFRNNKILMVQEGIDGQWTLPGGWADVGYTPFENVVKEVQEEAGMQVKPLRLLAVFDKTRHPHPPDAFHIYKLFVLCEDSGEEPRPGMETLDTDWYSRDQIPPLSLPRITESQIKYMFEFYDHPEKEMLCD